MIPPGAITFTVAVGRAAKAWFPDEWSRLPTEEQSFFEGGGSSYTFSKWRRSISLFEKAYDRLRVLMNDGSLRTFLRMPASAPEPIMPSSWQSSGADSFDLLHKGSVSFALASNATERGTVLIESGDLDAVLRGEPAPIWAVSERPAIQGEPAPAIETKGGRPPNPGADAFWIEACRMIHLGEQGADGQTRQQMVDALFAWSATKMRKPYAYDTVESKVKHLWGTLKFRKQD